MYTSDPILREAAKGIDETAEEFRPSFSTGFGELGFSILIRLPKARASMKAQLEQTITIVKEASPKIICALNGYKEAYMEAERHNKLSGVFPDLYAEAAFFNEYTEIATTTVNQLRHLHYTYRIPGPDQLVLSSIGHVNVEPAIKFWTEFPIFLASRLKRLADKDATSSR